MEDSFLFNYHDPCPNMETLDHNQDDDEFTSMMSAFTDSHANPTTLDFKRHVSNPVPEESRPLKQQKTSMNTNATAAWTSSLTSSSPNQICSIQFAGSEPEVKPKEEPWSSNSSTISFPNYNSDPSVISPASFGKGFALKTCQGAKRISTRSSRPSVQAQDHIMAERKRREKLSQRFIALSALLPGLKKVMNLTRSFALLTLWNLLLSHLVTLKIDDNYF